MSNSGKLNEEYKQHVQLTEIMSRISDAFVALDKNWCYIYMNKKAGELTGRDPAKMIGKNIWTELSDREGQPFQKAYEKAMAEQKYIYFEDYFPPFDKWFENHIYPSPEGLSIYFRDITERKKTEEKYRTLVEHSSDGIIQINEQGEIMFVNSTFCHMMGYSKEELLKMKVEDTYAETEKPLARQRLIDATNKGTISFERIMIKKNGTGFPVEVSINRIGNGQLLAIVRDITDRHKVELQIRRSIERFEMLAETTTDALWEWNFETGELWANKMHQHLYGLAQTDPVPNFEQWEQKIQPDDRTRIIAAQHEALASDKKVWISEYRFETKDKGFINIYDRTYIVRNDAGKPIRIMGSMMDITERVKAEEEIRNTAKRLRELTAHLQTIREEERKRIGREIHDELGQQLTAIKMDVTWIDKKTPEDAVIFKEKLKSVILLLDESNQSVRRILSELRPSILDDYGLLDALNWHGKSFTDNTGIPLEIISSKEDFKLPEPVATCIFRIFQESLTNVSRYAQAKKVMTTLNINTHSIEVSIEDDGIGFDKKALKNRRAFGIIGMKERVNSLGGKFELVSAKGKGTKIEISLPYKTLAS